MGYAIRITKKLSCDNPPKVFYVIDEQVTSQGYYITWPGSFGSIESAQHEIDLTIKN
jgi:hypothetical protein